MDHVDFITTKVGKDFIVSFALAGEDPDAIKSISLQRSPRYERFLQPHQYGVTIANDPVEEVHWSEESVEIATRSGHRHHLCLHHVDPADVEFAMALLERMNFDHRFSNSGETASADAKAEVLLDLLDCNDSHTVRDAIREAQQSRELVSSLLLDVVKNLAHSDWEGSLNTLAAYLLASFRDRRALEPLVSYFEASDEEAVDAWGDVVTEDLGAILASLSGGDLTPVKRLIACEAASEWARGAAVRAYVVAVVAGIVTHEAADQDLEELMNSRLRWTPGDAWDELACATADLGSRRLLPYIERAMERGVVNPRMITIEEVRADVSRGPEAMIETSRSYGKGHLIDDVVDATRWWSFFREEAARLDRRGEATEWREVDRSLPKAGRNDLCPCGSGKKFKKCCLT